jgi:hypothetical protein
LFTPQKPFFRLGGKAWRTAFLHSSIPSESTFVVFLISPFLLSHRYSVLRYSNRDAKPAMDYPLLFSAQHPTTIPPQNRGVETVVVSFEFSPTLPPGWWLSDDRSMRANILLRISAAR